MRLLSLIVATVTFTCACCADYYDTITVFGGSYADLGMGYLISTAGPPNSPIPPTPPYFEGKFSNGPLYLEYLPKLLDIKYPLLSMAVGGSTTGTENAEDLFNVRGLGGVATQISRFKTLFHRINPKSLTILEVGDDNFILLVEQGLITDPQAIVQSVENAISELKSDIKGIKQLGAHQIVVFNLPDPKLIPVFQSDPLLASIVSAMADTVNLALAELPKKENKDVFIYDFKRVVEDVLSEYARAGGNITDHTLTITSLDPYAVVENGPSPENLAYWDGIHFTAQIQSILAHYFASVLNAPRSIGAEMDLVFLSDDTQYDVVETRLAGLSRNMLSCCFTSFCGYNVLFDVGGKWGCKRSKSRDFGFDFDSYHVSAGVDRYFTNSFAADVLASWIRSEGDLFHQRGNLQLQDWATSLYGTYLIDCWGIDGQCAFHYYDFHEMNRKHLVFHRKAKARMDGYGPEISLKGSYYMNFENCSQFTFAPFLAADYRYIHLNGYHEHGAGLLDLKMSHQWENSFLGKIGLRMFSDNCSWCNTDVQIGYEHEFLRCELHQIKPLFFDIENNKFLYKRNKPDRDFLRFLARGDVKFCKDLSLIFEYIGCYGLNKHSQYSNTAKVEFKAIF